MNEEEQKEQLTPEPKRKSMLWPLLLWPLTGIPVFWLFNWIFWPKPDGRPHDVGYTLSASLLALMVSEAVCFGIGLWVGARAARQNPNKEMAFFFVVGFGMVGAALGLVYNFGGCILGPLLVNQF